MNYNKNQNECQPINVKKGKKLGTLSNNYEFEDNWRQWIKLFSLNRKLRYGIYFGSINKSQKIFFFKKEGI